MNAALRNLLLAMLPFVGATSGCLHHHAVSRAASGVLACEAAPGEATCYESSRFDPHGMLRHHVVERTTPGDSCDLVVVERTAFGDDGVLLERVVEQLRCRVVEQRVTSRYDVGRGVVEHRFERDDDHDDRIDHVRTRRVAMSSHTRAVAVDSSRARAIHLIGALAVQRPRPARTLRQPSVVARGPE